MKKVDIQNDENMTESCQSKRSNGNGDAHGIDRGTKRRQRFVLAGVAAAVAVAAVAIGLGVGGGSHHPAHRSRGQLRLRAPVVLERTNHHPHLHSCQAAVGSTWTRY